MTIQNFDLNLLKALDALLAERSVTKAAEQIHLSQPAMSGALKRLRDEFRDQLLIRNGREMDLTPLGRSLAGNVHEVLKSIRGILETQVQFDPATARRSIRLAMTDYAAMVLMPHVLERLCRESPFINCNVQIVDETVASALVNGDVDIFVGVREWIDQTEGRAATTLQSEPLFSDDFVCIVADDHPEIDGTLDLAQYCALSHGLVRFPRQLESLVERNWRHAGLDLQIGVIASNFATLLLMIPHTRLVATVQRRLARVLTAALPLRCVECPLPMPALEERLIWHPKAALDPAHGYVRALIFESANRAMQVTE